MPPLLLYILGFLACASLIVYSGSRLSKYGDIIADLTGMGKAWLGLVLMAGITSLPELVTGISAITIIGNPDIAVGDVMGSCAFNLLILALLDFLIPGRPLSSVVTKGHVMAGFLGSFLLTVAAISIVFGSVFPQIGWFSAASPLMVLLYLAAVWILFQSERKRAVEEPGNPSLSHPSESLISLKTAIRRYALFALLVVGSAIALPFFADRLADDLGLNKSFVGTLLVAAATSLPELVVSISAVRLGSVDIAVGNLLGSNIFNMFILGVDDFMYTKGPILMYVSQSHALSALVALLMTGIAGIGILYSRPYKRFLLGADALALILLYVLLMVALYNMK